MVQVWNHTNVIIGLPGGLTLGEGKNEVAEKDIKEALKHSSVQRKVENNLIEIEEEIETTEEIEENETEEIDWDEREYPKQTSEHSPWYELSNGERVNGLEKAKKAERKLIEEGEE